MAERLKSEIPSEPGTPFASVQRFERRKLFLGKCILGICQNHDVKGTSFVLPGTQRHAEFEVALRGCSRDTNDKFSRVHTATRSDCSFMCIFIRQVARLVKQGNSSQRSCRPNAPHIQIRTRRETDIIGWESSTTQLKNPSGRLKNSVTCSPDSTLCLDTSPTVVLRPLSGFISRRHTSWSTPFSCPCTFRGTVSRRPQWEPCSRRHPRSSPGLQVEHRTRLSPEIVQRVENS